MTEKEMNSNFEYYKVFYYVSKYENLTKAAAVLKTSQPNRKLNFSFGKNFTIIISSKKRQTAQGRNALEEKEERNRKGSAL